MNVNHSHFTFLDPFCGCGGFSLGMERAGFSCLAAIDFNPEAVTVFKKNFPHITHSLERDMTIFPPAELARLIETKTVDVIVGGPPCQGFSTVRQRDSANSGPRMIEHKRRHTPVSRHRQCRFALGCGDHRKSRTQSTQSYVDNNERSY